MAADKKKFAAALEYDPAYDNAPVLSAFGQGELAQRIIDTAQDAGVPVIEDPSLASLLKQVSIGDEIPESLYEVVAQLLIFLGETESKTKNR